MDQPGQRTIVVIEDEPAVREVIEAVLDSGGYRVVSTSDPEAAVEIVRRAAPDLVLCDIAMPELDGYGVLKALQADPETARYPVVFLTAHREFSERVQAFKFGVVDYITKPFTRDLLLKKVERVLGGLHRRPGSATADGGPGGVDGLLEDARRDARTGVLSVTGQEGGSRVVVRAGEVVEETAPIVAGPETRVEFHELDPTREHIVAHDPASLPGGASGLPRFDSLPEVFRKVLVVDDNPLFRRFLRDLLASQGFTVWEARSAEEALATALERRPWLILTDVKMPGIDGFELCRRVRSHSLVGHTPLIFLSGWDDYKERYRGLEAGADEYLSKGTPVRELLIRIQLILRRYAELGGHDRRGPGMAGGIEVIGAPAFLQMCHLGRLTGVCTVRWDARTLQVRFRDGEVVAAQCDRSTGAEAIFDFLAWTGGRFEFQPGNVGPGDPLGESFDQLILEGCRRLDESRRQS